MKLTAGAAMFTVAAVQLSPSAITDLHDTAVAHHLELSLAAASAAYDEVLRIEPPRELSPAEWRAVEQFAPRIFVTASEPFELKDVAAILNPDTGVVAYHLFWDDDIDGADDNEPCDHEIVWSVPSHDRRTLRSFHAYFHGRVLTAGPDALRDAAAHDGRPAVYVQWGKHGSMPLGWERLVIVADAAEAESEFYDTDRPISLETYNRGVWRKLSTEGRRRRDDPLAARHGWPSRFAGGWDAFASFPTSIDPVPLLRKRDAALVSRWNSATLSRWLIRYNFRPKLEWPDVATSAGRARQPR